jgi:CheY-like chemotaxis protein/anti-sigma regulatory factor (Ser/Thr protein kinase)
VSLDRAHVERSLRNLLDNAIKFTTRGHIRISAHARGDQLAFCVQDSGRGIPLEFQKLVFEEFYQVGNAERDRRKGLGLGLSIVSRLASLMGGTIVVDSQPGVGTTFTMRVPLIRATEQVSNSDRPAPDKPDLSGWQVLVIDDEEIVRKGMSALLSSWGASVAQADGLQQVRSLGSAALGAMRRLCLCDLRLRNGEDGIETAQVLRGENPQLRILLITGDTAAHRIEQATQSGLPLLHKPVTPAQLARAIRHATQP